MSPLPHDLFTLDHLNRFGSELVAQTNARSPRRDPVAGVIRRSEVRVRGSEDEAIGKTTRRRRIGYTGIEVNMPGKPPVHGQREHVDRSFATWRQGAVDGTGQRLVGAEGAERRAIDGIYGATWEVHERSSSSCGADGEEALPGAVISANDVEGRRHRILHTSPEHVLVPVG